MKTGLLLIGFVLFGSTAWARFGAPSGLHCGSDAKVHYSVNHGHGSGCGESGHEYIVKQERDWATKTIAVTTAWMPAKRPNTGACHYWGPIYGGGEVETYVGTWKVMIDGKLAGEYTYSEATTSEHDGKDVVYTKRCQMKSGSTRD